MQYKLPESIIVTQITQILKQLKYDIGNAEEIILDLSAVTTIDSAGIAFLVYLKSKYQNIKFLYITTQIDNLCQLYKIKL